MTVAWVTLIAFIVGFIAIGIGVFFTIKNLKRNYKVNTPVNTVVPIKYGTEYIKIICK